MMFDELPTQRKTHRTLERRPFERIALILQGGGALASYQTGVYQALAEANLHPDWVAGISVGAVNSALIAGNSPQKRVERLREFWEAITTAPFALADFDLYEPRGDLDPQPGQSGVRCRSPAGARGGLGHPLHH
jgi:NTE family protein